LNTPIKNLVWTTEGGYPTLFRSRTFVCPIET